MKTVFDNDMLAHVWAQGTQSHGKNANNTFRFDGGMLYSYAAKIAKRQANAQGVTCAILIASRTWSVTTSSHQRAAAGAAHGLGLPVFYVADVDPRTDADHLANFHAIIAARDAAAKVAERARSDWRRDDARRQAERLDKSAAEYAALFIKGDPAKLAKKLERESAKAERERKQREAERAKAAEDAARRLAPVVDALCVAWRQNRDWSEAWHTALCTAHNGGADQYFLRDLFDSHTLLRVNGDTVETSRGAEFPVEHAKRAFPILAKFVSRKEGWEFGNAAIRLGHFTVDRVEADGTIVAGCHRVAWSEVELCAKSLGLVPVDA